MGAVEIHLASLGIRLLYMDKMEYDRNLALLSSKLEERALEKLWAEGNGMSLEQTIRLALGIR